MPQRCLASVSDVSFAMDVEPMLAWTQSSHTAGDIYWPIRSHLLEAEVSVQARESDFGVVRLRHLLDGCVKLLVK